MMIKFVQNWLRIGLLTASFFAFPGLVVPAQQLDTAAVVHQVDAAVKARIDSLDGYTVTEHYAVYRSKDEVHPAAEMTVLTTYKKESGKDYTIISQSGSSVFRDLVLNAILDNEKHLNQPGTREGAWITSANYVMKLKPGGIQQLDGRDCLVLALTPRRKETYLIDGILWVDAKDGSIVQVQGTSSKSSSLVTGPTQLTRQYAKIGGYSQATHLRAVSNSFMFGATIVKVDYQDYHLQLHPPA